MTHTNKPQPTFAPRDRTALLEAVRAATASIESEQLDVDGAFPSDAIKALRRHGVLHAPFPADMGGLDLGSTEGDQTSFFEILATLGEANLPLGRLYEGHVNAIKLVRLYGSAANLDLLEAEASAGRLSGVWMAEDGCPLSLHFKGGEFIDGQRSLSGRKILASGAGHIRRPLVAAQSDEGSVLLLPHVAAADRVDLSAWTVRGMKASATGSVDFTDIPIGSDEIVGVPGDYMRSPFFRGGAWRVMAVQYGGVRALMEAYRLQVTGAKRDGDRLQRARFGEAMAALETARLWILEAGRRAETPSEDPAAIDAYVDLMRGAFEQAALTIVESVQKSLGLKAFMRGNPVDRIIRDLTTYLRQPALDASLDSAATFFFLRPIGGPR